MGFKDMKQVHPSPVQVWEKDKEPMLFFLQQHDPQDVITELLHLEDTGIWKTLPGPQWFLDIRSHFGARSLSPASIVATAWKYCALLAYRAGDHSALFILNAALDMVDRKLPQIVARSNEIDDIEEAITEARMRLIYAVKGPWK